jgi:serine/threonine protein kinase
MSNDIPDFARLLIQAVRKLHDVGILHCDIKPDNIAWDGEKRVVSLLDFGHAQLESGAKCREGTEGYDAPEVYRERQPNSRLSDTFSVGKTLLNVVDSATVEDSSSNSSNQSEKHYLYETKQVEAVVEKLCTETLSERLSLEQAESMLLKSSALGSSPPMKRVRFQTLELIESSK